MLRKDSQIIGAKIHATDGPVGSVIDLLFDDAAWTLRWAVIDTGTWLPGRHVLLPPSHLTPVDGDETAFAVPLTREEVKLSPDIQSDPPVSRQFEQQLYSHYQWEPYWVVGVPISGYPMPILPPDAGSLSELSGDAHLRSAKQVDGYRIEASDGVIGHLNHFLIDPERWVIRFLETDTHDWFGGRKVLIAPGKIGEIDWFEHRIHVRLTRAEVEASPAYDPSITVDRAQTKRVYEHYGLPDQWL